MVWAVPFLRKPLVFYDPGSGLSGPLRVGYSVLPI
jgi:hypothetical protein